MPFQIIRDEITKVKADAIVNMANLNVTVGSGMDFAAYQAVSKDELLAERKKIGLLPPGKAAITSALNLNAKYMIHVCGSWWMDGEHDEIPVLKDCYEKALKLAKDNGCESIAFPLIATGTYGFPQKLGIQIAVDVFTEFLQDNEMKITLVVFGNSAVSVSGELLEEVKSYIDDIYVENAVDEECKSAYEDEYEESSSHNSFFGRVSELLKHDNGKAEDFLKSEAVTSASMPGMAASSFEKKKEESLEDVLKNIYTESFEKHLQHLIQKKGLKNSEVYVAANISKQYFSKLLKGQVKPSKGKILALAVGLRLNLDETIDFLRIAGYALSPISQTDAVVKYFIEHQVYNVLKIDIVLFDYGLDPLSNV